MTNGYMVYLLRILAAQGALASVYTDPDDPEGFSAGFVEAVDGQHVLMCDLSPWGQIDGWRVRRNQDVIQVLAGEEYEQRLAMLLAYHKQHHRCFFTEAPAEDTDLLLSVLIACKERGEIVSVIMGDDMITAACWRPTVCGSNCGCWTSSAARRKKRPSPCAKSRFWKSPPRKSRCTPCWKRWPGRR